MTARPVLAALAAAALVVLVAARLLVRGRGGPVQIGAEAGGGGRRTVSVDARGARAAAVAVGAGGGWILGQLPLALVGAVTVAAWPPVASAIRSRRRRARVERAVPDLVDLFLVAASAGQPVAASLAVVAARSPDAVEVPVRTAAERFRRGLPLAECLRQLGSELGRSGEPLAAALQQAAADGVPLVPLLEGVAASARDQRRRRAQEVARRLPVTMLFPLVACILPAAIVLAVVPVLVVSIASLSS